MHIVDLDPRDERRIRQAAEVMRQAFRAIVADDLTLEQAMEEVHASLAPGHISRVALDDAGNVAGWIGGSRQYSHAWELHPLVVRPDLQGKGIGTALVADLETLVRERGGLTLYLGSDDELGLTTLAGVDLYPDPWPHIAAIQNPGRHPYAFYRKQGFHIVGVIPDANGPGKPDILMAKRVG